MSSGNETPRSPDRNPAKKRKLEEGHSSGKDKLENPFERLRDELLTYSFTNRQFEILAKLCDTRANAHQPSPPSVIASEILAELEDEDLSEEESEQFKQAEKELQQVIDEIKVLQAAHDVDTEDYQEKVTITLTFQYHKHLVTVEAISDDPHLADPLYELIVDGETRGELYTQELKDLLQISSKIPFKLFRKLMIHLCRNLDDYDRFDFEEAWE